MRGTRVASSGAHVNYPMLMAPAPNAN